MKQKERFTKNPARVRFWKIIGLALLANAVCLPTNLLYDFSVPEVVASNYLILLLNVGYYAFSAALIGSLSASKTERFAACWHYGNRYLVLAIVLTVFLAALFCKMLCTAAFPALYMTLAGFAAVMGFYCGKEMAQVSVPCCKD